MTTSRLASSIIGLGLLALGCPAPPSESGPPSPSAPSSPPARASSEPAAAVSTPAQTPEAPARATKGVRLTATAEPSALLAIVDGALVRLDADGLTRVDGSSPLHELRRGLGGQVHALRGHELVGLTNDGLETLVRVDPSLASPHSGVLTADQPRAWIASADGISALEGEAWTTTSLAELGFEAGERPQLGLDARGRVWLVAPQRVLVRDRGVESWREPQVPPMPPSYALSQPRHAPGGLVHVLNHHRLTRLDPSFFDSVLVDPRAELEFEFLAIAATGHAALATRGCALARVPPKPPTKIWRFAAGEFPCTRIDALAIDGQLRVWVASDHGLTMISPTRDVRDHPRGSIAGLDGQISALLALGRGPAERIAPAAGG